jgi:hypothetical protein
MRKEWRFWLVDSGWPGTILVCASTSLVAAHALVPAFDRATEAPAVDHRNWTYAENAREFAEVHPHSESPDLSTVLLDLSVPSVTGAAQAGTDWKAQPGRAGATRAALSLRAWRAQARPVYERMFRVRLPERLARVRPSIRIARRARDCC